MGKPIEATIMAEVTYVRQKANGAFSTVSQAHNDFVADIVVALTDYRNNNGGDNPSDFTIHTTALANGSIVSETSYVNSTAYEIKFTYDAGFHPTYDPATVVNPADAVEGDWQYSVGQSGWTVAKKA